MKQTIFENTFFTTNLDTNPTNTTETTVQRNIKEIHHSLVENHIQSLKPNKIINQPAPPINKDKQTLLRKENPTHACTTQNKQISFPQKLPPQNRSTKPPNPTVPSMQHLKPRYQIPVHL